MTITVAILFIVKEAANIAAALKKLGKNAAASRIVAHGEKPTTFVK